MIPYKHRRILGYVIFAISLLGVLFLSFFASGNHLVLSTFFIVCAIVAIFSIRFNRTEEKEFFEIVKNPVSDDLNEQIR